MRVRRQAKKLQALGCVKRTCFLVFLHILGIGEAESPFHDEQEVRISEPLWRPVLAAATSSAASGIFFAAHDRGAVGERVREPDENRIAASTQMTISSAAATGDLTDGGERQELEARKSRSENGVDRIAGGFAESPAPWRSCHASIGKPVPARVRRQSGFSSMCSMAWRTRWRSRAEQIFDIGHAVMAEGNRLRPTERWVKAGINRCRHAVRPVEKCRDPAG